MRVLTVAASTFILLLMGNWVASVSAQEVPAPGVQTNNPQYYPDYQPLSEAQPSATDFPTPSQPNVAFPRTDAAPETPNVAPRSDGLNAIGAGDLVVIVSNVAVPGISPELQRVVQQAVSTRAGGNTTRNQLQNDIASILNTGLFANATVETATTPNGLNVVYRVEPIVVRQFQLSGAQVLPPEVVSQIYAAQLGTPVSPPLLDQGVQQINQWYSQNGYTLARVLSLRPSRTGVITIEVAEGVIGEVEFRFANKQGQTVDDQGRPIRGRSRPDFLQQEVQLKPGQVFREEVAREDLQRLTRLGLFDRAEVALGGDARRVTVIYDLRERSARSANLGGGYNSDIGFYGAVTYTDQNVGGTGQIFRNNVQVSTRGDVQFNTSFTSPYRPSNPDRLGYRVEAFRRRGLSPVFDDEIELDNDDQAREGRFGGSASLLGRLGDWDATLGLNYTRISIRDSEGELFAQDRRGNELTLSGTGIDDLTTVSLAVTKDRRDNPEYPTRGSVTTLSTEQSIPIGLGHIVMNRLQANYAQYYPVRWLETGDLTEVVAVNLQAGTMLGNAPPYNAFILGGPNSVRGYEFGDLGTGRSYVLGSAEYRFPILSTPVIGVVFADFASDLGSGDTLVGRPGPERGKPGTGFGYGAGVRVRSPIGIIRADLGFNNDGERRFQFGFGQRF